MSVSAATVEEAKALTTRITQSTDEFAKLLHEAWKIKVWVPLNYTGFKKWLSEEVGISRSRGYQLIAIAQLEELVRGTITPLPKPFILSDWRTRAVIAHGVEVVMELRATTATANTGEVKARIDTKKSATRFDRELDEHERKNQLYQLDRAETEVEAGVTENSFRTWGNIMNGACSKRTKRVAGAGLVGVMAFSLVGCFPAIGANFLNPNGPGTERTSQDYGDAAGSGTKVTDSLGEYETIELNSQSRLGSYDPIFVDPAAYTAGFTDADLAEAQSFGINYMIKEFISSTALDTGAAGYADWYSSKAPQYYSAEILNDPTTQNGTADTILTNATKVQIPQLIRDGKPRESFLTLGINVISTQTYNGAPYIDLSTAYEVDYRVSDQSAITFSAQVAGLSESDFLASELPKDSLKDGKGENIYSSDGLANVRLIKQDGKWVIIGFECDSNFSTVDFINQ
ncbi:hypothetical protein [Cryobacterium aureum]|uniref:hypothetical protein n=1 Tax=Cryobacterium aureum TaxID=995037 RepID=UPI00101ADC5B|nr:hypothetical protein [Cryobacterium aureum]